jgi:hypothetical protein
LLLLVDLCVCSFVVVIFGPFFLAAALQLIHRTGD